MSSTTQDPTASPAQDTLTLTGDADTGISRYVVVEINTSRYGIITDATVELVSSSAVPVTRVPKSPRYVRGVVNHRGSIIPVVDTRALLGLPTAQEQAQQMMDLFKSCEVDFNDRLDALEHVVRTKDKPADTRQCAFGRWYTDIQSDPRKMQTLVQYHQSIRGLIGRFEHPYKRLQSLPGELLELRQNGRVDEALERIELARKTELRELKGLFRTMRELVSTGLRTMLVITELGERRAAFVVDAVHTVRDCAEDQIEPLPDSATGGEFLRGLVYQTDGNYILICDLDRMYDLACPRS